MGVMSNFSLETYRHAGIFEGFCQYSRKWHILPTLSIEFDRIFLYFMQKILTDSGYIMLDLVYVLNDSI